MTSYSHAVRPARMPAKWQLISVPALLMACGACSGESTSNLHETDNDRTASSNARQQPIATDAGGDSDSAARPSATDAGSSVRLADAEPPALAGRSRSQNNNNLASGEADAGFQDDRVDSGPSAGAFRVALGETQVLAPLAGSLATPAAGQEDIGFYGTDLGRSTVHQGAVRFLFGDTWAEPDATMIDPDHDDTQGSVSLDAFPDGAAVERYIAEHPAGAGLPAWRAEGPPMTLVARDDKVLPIVPYRDGSALGMSLGRTPVAVWSDGKDGLFAILNRIQPLACAAEEPRCPKDFECDTELGGGLGVAREGVMPCVIGTDPGCAPVSSGGFCQDRTSSVYSALDADGRRQAVVYTEEIGNEDVTQPGHFFTSPFHTNKFINPSARTVADFDPTRADGVGNVYTAATGAGEHEKLFVWGRPWFSGARGRDSRLYFMYLDVPRYSETGEFDLEPRYFTGVDAGVPQFSAREIDAVPLDLSYAEGDPSTEVVDQVGELSVTWVEPLQKWIMLYGGDYARAALLLMQGNGLNDVTKDPFGGVLVRFADQPWGPWSAPEYILKAHTETDEIIALTNAPKGILARPDCTSVDCPPGEPGYSMSERGGFYGAHMIEPWTMEREEEVDVYWVVSTWNPYQVVLLKTSLSLREQSQ